jgi:hypothetical protein
LRLRCSGGGGSTSGTSTACLADPQETNGPFPSDGTNSVNGAVSNVLTASGIVRSDITSSFGTSTNVAPGVPLTLTINLEDISTACSLLTSYAIYIWHCNRDGNYSLYSNGVQNENYLRGVQVTDGNGQANAILTTQMAMPRDICTTVYAAASGYSTSVTNLSSITTSNDGVFDGSSSAQIAQQTPALTGSVSSGYTGTITIGVAV